MANPQALLLRIDSDMSGLRTELARSEQAMTSTAGRMAGQLRVIDGGLSQSAGRFRLYRGAIQQAGFQVGDFAVQMASGQNAIVAFTQQGSQMLQIFGPWGAILGAALSIVGAITVGLYKSSESHKSATAAIEEEKKAREAWNAVMLTSEERSQADLESTRMATEERLKATREIERNTLARLEADKAALGTILEEAQRPVRGGVGAGAARAEAQATVDAMRGVDDQIEATSARLGVLEGQLRDINDPSKLGSSREAAAKAGEQAAKAEEAWLKSVDSALQQADEVEQRAAKQVFDKTRTDLEKYDAEVEKLNFLHETGRLDAETYRRALEQLDGTYLKLTDEIHRTREAQDRYARAIDSGFESAIRSGGNWRNAMLSFLADVQRAFVMSATGGQSLGSLVVQGVGSFFSAGMGSGGGAIDTDAMIADIAANGIPQRAMGGPVAAGRPYIVGERGPELFVPERGGAIVPNGADGGGIVVNQIFQTGVTRAELAAILPQVQAAAVAGAQEARRRDPKFFS